MFSLSRNRGVVENDEAAMSLFPSLYDDCVEFYFADQNGEKTPTNVGGVATDANVMNKLMLVDDDVLSLTACGFDWLPDNGFDWLPDNCIATPDILDMVMDLCAAEESVDSKTFIIFSNRYSPTARCCVEYRHVFRSLVSALVLNRLDYCNSLLIDLSLTHIQSVSSQFKNAAAWLIFSLRRCDRITDALISLHWLRVLERITFKHHPPVDVRSSDDAGQPQYPKSGRKACHRSSEKHKQLVLDVQQVKSSDTARQAQYVDRRRRNNEACKRTRAKRKQETTHMQQEIVSLQQVNAGLLLRVTELERKLGREQ